MHELAVLVELEVGAVNVLQQGCLSCQHFPGGSNNLRRARRGDQDHAIDVAVQEIAGGNGESRDGDRVADTDADRIAMRDDKTRAEELELLQRAHLMDIAQTA